MTQTPFPCPQLTALPSGHFRLDATHFSLQELTPLLRHLHAGCPDCQVVFLTPTGPQAFSVAAGGGSTTRRPCSLIHCRHRKGSDA